MKPLKNKVAVVTGAGHGIGSGMVRVFAEGEMKVIVSDIDESAASAVAEAVRNQGGEAIAVAADVSKRDSVENLAQRALEKFGSVHVICNNAGVLVGGPMMEITQDDWQWLLSVNLLGVVNGSQVFAPILVEQGEGHIVNTASVGGFLSFPNLAIYCTTKFAVVGYSDALALELAPHGVGVSILCPGKVNSNLDHSDEIRPDHLANAGGKSDELGDLSDGMDPLEVGRHVLAGIESNAGYIFTHPEFREIFEGRFQKILANFAPSSE